MRPVKDEVIKAIKLAYTGHLPGLMDEDADEIATIVLQSTLLVFNVLRRANTSQTEAENVMAVASDIVSSAIERRTRRAHCSKVSWDAW